MQGQDRIRFFKGIADTLQTTPKEGVIVTAIEVTTDENL